ncbi:MAG TPA: DUF488 domain-containing protein [Flavobacterium sp.]|nr:DUF488 domain-containing protein [Flavobacterium sp.]
MKGFVVKRIYEPCTAQDGCRVLVDRLWPRGISKENAKLDRWCKELAPSTELRKWFDHIDERFDQFAKKYKKELQEHLEQLEELKEIAVHKQVCLLYGAKNENHNQAVVLKSVLENL